MIELKESRTKLDFLQTIGRLKVAGNAVVTFRLNGIEVEFTPEEWNKFLDYAQSGYGAWTLTE